MAYCCETNRINPIIHEVGCNHCADCAALRAELTKTNETIARLRKNIGIALQIATDQCECGGAGPGEGCGMNDIYHALTEGTKKEQ